MVFIITGDAEADGRSVGMLLAQDLGWEFVDAKNLSPHTNLDARNYSSLANGDPAARIGTLSAAINFWIYEWRDVVVAYPMLTENDRRELSEMSSLVKLVCLEASRATGRPSFHNRHASPEPAQKMLTVDSSRQVEEIISEIVSALILTRKSQYPATNPGNVCTTKAGAGMQPVLRVLSSGAR